MIKLEKNLLSISNSLKSFNRETGPKLQFVKTNIIQGGTDNPKSDFGLKIINIVYNQNPSILYEYSIKMNDGTILNNGSLCSYSGIKTGRSPSDKRIVINETNKNEIWYGNESPNISMDENTYKINRETTICSLNMKDILFVFDGYACWDKNHQIKVRIISTRPYHALFMHNMLIRPTIQELENFGDPDFTILNAGEFPCNRFLSEMTSSTSIDFNFDQKEMLILGTQYAGEMKKGIFSLLHYLMPKKNILSLHSSCNISNDKKNICLFFGLSGTGKTTLSADSNRKLIGDDEHCWTDEGVFNIEGGCYAKCKGLSKEKEPEIYNCIKFGSILENIIYDDNTREPNFDNISITQNTRLSYPIYYIDNAEIPCICNHPQNIIFLTCDTYGVFPPVSELSTEQAMYYFISGYTSKVPGTEVGIHKPIPTFSACFGEAFLVCNPLVYANLLKDKIKKHNSKVWLINTGWVKGSFNNGGERCPLKFTRQIVNLIYNNQLNKYDSKILPLFNIKYFVNIDNIPNEILNPVDCENKQQYLDNILILSDLFKENFSKYNIKELEMYGPK